MATSKSPKERKFVSASGATAPKPKSTNSTKTTKKAETDDNSAVAVRKASQGKATGLRITAVILWLAAVAFEVLVICLLNGILYIPGDITLWLIVGIALDLVCVVIGSLLWKHANRLDPASKKNKLKFFLWNNMGVIATIVAFVPLVIILLKDKKLDAKLKKLVTVIAAIALAIAALFSIDYNPVSFEDLAVAQQDSQIQSDGTAYWTRWGKSYHFDPDCSTLMNSAVVYQGTIEEAFEAHRTDPCDFCAGGDEAKQN